MLSLHSAATAQADKNCTCKHVLSLQAGEAFCTGGFTC